MEACGQEGRGPTWAVAPTRRRRRAVAACNCKYVTDYHYKISYWEETATDA